MYQTCKSFIIQEAGSYDGFKDIIRSVLKRLEQDGHLCQKPRTENVTYLVSISESSAVQPHSKGKC